jgi:hypothetical protein
MILSDGPRPLRWKLRAASTRQTKKVRTVWPATRSLVPTYLRWDRSLGTLPYPHR